MSGFEHDASVIRIAITPEPSDEEAAAIAAVVTVLAVAGSESRPAPRQPVDRWSRAGREEAMRRPLAHAPRREGIRD